MNVFEDLNYLKEKHKELFPFDGVVKISKEQYNYLVNDKRTFKERYKDTIKLLKRMVKCLKKK